MRKSLKAQVTLFMILGIVIVSSFGFVYYLSNYYTKQQLEKKVDKIYGEIMQNTPIKLYVSKCVERSLDDGLELIGEGGGVIFSNETGSMIPYLSNRGITDPENVYYEGHNITLVEKGILPIDTISESYSALPQYPCKRVLSEGTICPGGELNNPTNACYFIWDSGVSEDVNCVPAPATSNYGLDEEASFPFGKKRFFALETQNKIRLRPSIKEQIETYVSNNTFDCVNFTGIALLTGQNITSGYPATNTTIGSDDVNIIVKFPVVITLEGKPPITRIVEFRSSKNVRLKEIRDAVDKWTTRDNTNLSVNLLDELRKELNNNYEITETKGTDYDIFKIKDLIYVANDNPAYIFQFARQNRWPVLDYVTDDVDNYKDLLKIGKAPYHYPNVSYGYDYVIPTGTSIIITPFAYDPDEDTLTYNYTGWRENYLEYWNFTKELELKETLGNCSFYPANCTYKNYTEVPKNWTGSNSDYRKGGTDGSVNISTNSDEIGPHIVRVNVSDGVYSDYQDVRILVYGVPTINAAGENYFGGLDASSEDPYYLDTRGTSSICSDRIYDWQDASEETNVLSDSRIRIWITNHTLYSGEADYVALLNEVPTTSASDFDINDVRGAFSNYSGFNYPTQKSYLHNISLSIQSINCPGPIYTVTLPVKVVQCLPHGGNVAPYPYNNMDYSVLGGNGYNNYIPGSDPFLANHICCIENPSSGDYEIASMGTKCYHFESYGFKPNSSMEYYPANESREDADGVIGNPDAITIKPIVYDTSGNDVSAAWAELESMTLPDVKTYDNDIYHRTLGQACGGRGNACTGPVTDKWEVHTACSDKDVSKGEVETCSGPALPLASNNYCRFGFDSNGKPCGQFDLNNIPACTPYSYGQSFEKDYLKLNDATGICNPNWRISIEGDEGTYDTAAGDYLCQGTCGGIGGTCKKAINCKLISGYNYKLPEKDIPSTYIQGNYVTNEIYGYSAGNTISGWGSPKIDTVIPPSAPKPNELLSEPSIYTWCDGKCFTSGGSKPSPTQLASSGNENYCTTRGYSAYKRPLQLQDSIKFESVDLDLQGYYCGICGIESNVNQVLNWIKGGETFPGTTKGSYGCCGDDNSEYMQNCAKEGNPHLTCIPDPLCCQSQTDCTNSSYECASSGDISKFDQVTAYCDNAVWKDFDNNQAKCTGNGYSWDSVGECCGDDGTYDSWAFADEPWNLCFQGSKKFCTTTEACKNPTTIGSDSYYCNGAQWIKNINPAGQVCGISSGPPTYSLTPPKGLCSDNGMQTGTFKCCNDANEYTQTCAKDGNPWLACNSIGTCCSNPTDCVSLVNTCIASGVVSNFALGSAYCDNAVWKDLDTNQLKCEDASYTWNDNGDPGKKCCGDDKSLDNWAFTDDKQYACNSGVRKECTPALSCTVLSLDDGKYYCNGAQWVKDNPGGKACGNPDASHNLIQEGLCTTPDATNYNCDKTGPIVKILWHGSTYYVTNCDRTSYLGDPCDNTPTNPAYFEEEGKCLWSNDCKKCDGKKIDGTDICEQGCGSSAVCQDQEPGILFGPPLNRKLCKDDCNLCPSTEAYVPDGPIWKCGCNGNIGKSCDKDHDGNANGYCDTNFNCIGDV